MARLVDTGVLSPRQARILAFIREYIAEHGYAPSLREIGEDEHLHLSSVAHQLTELEAAGLVTRDARVARSLRVAQQP